MGVSNYFNNQKAYTEQLLLEDLIIESVKNHGIDVYYIPKNSQSSIDPLFGDDPVKMYDKAIKLEMYMETFRDYEGNKEFFSKFGLEIQETARLCVARRTFEKYVWKELPPKEGDLVYLPVQYKLMEIKFVEEEKNFFQLGRDSVNPYMYSLSMEAFKYNGELLQTGVTEIDRIANKQAFNLDHILASGGSGSYVNYEWAYQGDSLENCIAKGVVSKWDLPNRTLTLRNIKNDFLPGMPIIGNSSGAVWNLESDNTMQDSNIRDINDNVRIELESDNYLNFDENNPFGNPHEF